MTVFSRPTAFLYHLGNALRWTCSMGMNIDDGRLGPWDLGPWDFVDGFRAIVLQQQLVGRNFRQISMARCRGRLKLSGGADRSANADPESSIQSRPFIASRL